jgi:hypothetical protein
MDIPIFFEDIYLNIEIFNAIYIKTISAETDIFITSL